MFATRVSKKLPSLIKSTSPSSSSSCSVLIDSFSQHLTISSSSCHNNTRTSSSTQARCSFSTVSENVMNSDEEREVVTFIGLNNLSDNPGAVKRVRFARFSQSFFF
jgi:hypothetical protein